MTTFRFEEPDPDDRDTGPDYFLSHPGRETPPAQRPADRDGGDEPRSRGCLARMWWVMLLVTGIAVGAGYVRYFVPHTTDARLVGRVASLEKRGVLFKVYETAIIPDAGGAGVEASVASDSVASILRAAQTAGRPVTVSIDKYFSTLPWRGQSDNVITAATIQ